MQSLSSLCPHTVLMGSMRLAGEQHAYCSLCFLAWPSAKSAVALQRRRVDPANDE